MTESASSQLSPRLRRLTIIAIVIGGVLVVLFGVRAVRSFFHLREMGRRPTMTDVSQIRGWMTVPYIAKAYAVPEEELFDALGLPGPENRKRSLADMNRALAPGKPGLMVETVQDAITRFQSRHPPRGEPPKPPAGSKP